MAHKCVTCGKGNYIRTQRANRVEEHDDFIIEIPADMEALEPFVLKKAVL